MRSKDCQTFRKTIITKAWIFSLVLIIVACEARKSIVIDRYENGAVKKIHEFGIEKANRALVREIGLHPNGDTSYTGYLDGSKLDSTWKIWFEKEDRLWEIHNFKDGERWGKQMRWYKNGNPRNLDFFYIEDRDSIQIEWYRNGNKKLEGNWKDNQKTGLWTYWYSNGNMKKQGEINGGWFEDKSSLSYWTRDFIPIKQGKWSYWNKKGILEKEEWYYWGILKKHKTYN